jgi:hypothetical protein
MGKIKYSEKGDGVASLPLPEKATSYLDMLFGGEDVADDMEVIKQSGAENYVPPQSHTVGDGFTVSNRHRDSLSG